MTGAPAPSEIVTLLTDFGVSDPFVGVMKGVMLNEHAGLRLVDISHAVPPQDIELAEFWLRTSHHWFPAGSVHLCVVDPGVGSDRAALAVCAHEQYFVAPDNGVLSGVIRSDTRAAVRRIDAAELGIELPSRTFHGRDLFARVASRLASQKLQFASIGPTAQPVLLPERPALRSPDELVGRVIAVDHFGNLISNLPGAWLEASDIAVEIAGRKLRRVGTYAEAEVAECVALISSFDTLEVAVRNGHAANLLGVGRDAELRVVRQRRAT
ncbi:MAG: SAM hydrolase/SAM-dependent halogenase family protein [Myxococcota bacterium]